MSANNQIVVIGRAGNSPKEGLKQTQGGTAIAEVRLAVNRPTKDAQGNPVTDWISCQFWDKNAERLADFVQKGDLISVAGSLRVDNWETQGGEKRQKYFVHGENFQMLESRSAREERMGTAAQQPTKQQSKSSRQEDSYAMDEDELPPF